MSVEKVEGVSTVSTRVRAPSAGLALHLERLCLYNREISLAALLKQLAKSKNQHDK